MASRQALHIFTPSRRAMHILTSSRGIASTPHLSSFGWFDKIKSTITGKKPEEASEASSFTLIQFADTMEKARKLGTFKNFVAGRASEKHSAVLRYLGAIDPTGENLRNTDKINATKHCNCTIADVEHILAKYTWAKEAQKKIAKLKEEGKPLPKSFNEVQNLMGSTPVDVGRSNLAKSGQISRNAFCPCGSKKRYKRCCGAS
uniref:Protein translocase subunit SecA n=1 Tax=Zea mays TaxID=4577 RepID=A0A804R3Y6_MAIZE